MQRTIDSIDGVYTIYERTNGPGKQRNLVAITNH